MLLSLASVLASASEEVHHAPRTARATRVPVIVGVAEFPVLRPHLWLLLLLLCPAVERFGLVETAALKVGLLIA